MKSDLRNYIGKSKGQNVEGDLDSKKQSAVSGHGEVLY